MTTNLLRFNNITPDRLEYLGQPVDRLKYMGKLIYSRVDRPRIASFTMAPGYGVQGAPIGSVINLSWDIEGSVDTTTLEARPVGSSGAWQREGISAITGTDSDPIAWPSVDTDYRLTVTNSLGESDTITQTFFRTLAPSISTWSYSNFHQYPGAPTISNWTFNLTCLCWPKPIIAITGSTEGNIHISQQRTTRTSVENGWTFDQRHSIGGNPDSNEVWTVTVTNPTTAEQAQATMRLGQ